MSLVKEKGWIAFRKGLRGVTTKVLMTQTCFLHLGFMSDEGGGGNGERFSPFQRSVDRIP